MRTLLLVTMVCLPGAVLAQTEEPAPVADPTAHRHLGWIFRLDIGADYLKTSASQDGGSLSLSKPGIAAGIVLGHAVSERGCNKRAKSKKPSYRPATARPGCRSAKGAGHPIRAGAHYRIVS